MVIYSEKLNKEFKTVDECVKAEQEYEAKVAAEKAAKEKAIAEAKARQEALVNDRKTRATEVEDAYKAVVEAQKVYREKLNAFVKDYGSFHMTLKTGDGNPFDLFHGFFENWF